MGQRDCSRAPVGLAMTVIVANHPGFAVRLIVLDRSTAGVAAVMAVDRATTGLAAEMHSKHERNKLHQFLMGLNETFNSVRSNILATDPPLSVNCAYAFMIQEEKHQAMVSQKSISIPDVEAFHTSISKFGNSCPRNGNSHPKYKCNHYKWQGHTKDHRYDLIGYLEGWEKGKSNHTNKNTRPNSTTACVQSDPLGPPIVGLTLEQYFQLLCLLNTEASQEASVNMTGKTTTSVSTSDQASHTQIAWGMLCDSIYCLHPHSPSFALTSRANGSYQLWHNKLGHASLQQLSLSLGDGFSTPIKHACDACERDKHCRNPFPLSSFRATTPFALIHCDIWGAYHVLSLSGARYFLTIVDDFSHYTWIYLTKNKFETYQLLVSFYHMVRTQSNGEIKAVRSDNGKEFMSGPMQISCAYLQIVFTTAYTINYLPSTPLQDKTLYEVLFGKPPTYGHFRTFGCLCYAQHRPLLGDKFVARTDHCLFIGYPNAQKGYHVILNTKEVFTSWDVTFYEDVFPFLSTPPKTQNDEMPRPNNIVVPLPQLDDGIDMVTQPNN
ncbi:PREDICTED: uncharacterized protein LOC104598693 [Nelumbo nucifera]|uniref:Uncharacterized protein LOC104598693 n=1 Tax=Nelumbo nucifera TaxID=4432 RepID=A0A1U8AAT5_NELNU|nr:PREDICTED: uncharacterized protein LOC104598693 [Nelumbo nucifera]